MTHVCVSNEPQPGLFCEVWLFCQAPDVHDLVLTFIWVRSLWHGPVTRWLPELRHLEGTDHDEDDAAALDGADGTRRVRPSIAHSVDVVE